MQVIRQLSKGTTRAFLAAAMCTAIGASANADVIYDSEGFEPTKFTADITVEGQDGWLRAGGISTAVVSTSAPNQGGVHALELKRNGIEEPTFYAVNVSGATAQPHEQFVFVDFDMRVEDALDQDPDEDFESYGPGFGLDVYTTGTNRIASFLVDAGTGTLLQPGAPEVAIGITLGEYQSWRMVLDFVDQVSYLLLDGDIKVTRPFLNPVDYAGGDRLTDAPLIISKTDDFYDYVEGTAYVDNYIITDSDVIPEPGSLALLALGGMMMLRRRRGE